MRTSPATAVAFTTTFCNGSVTSGMMLPISVTVPPLRVQSIAPATVSFLPTASSARSTPRPSVSRITSATSSAPETMQHFVGANLPGQFQPRRIHVGDEHALATRGPRSLKRKQADHARADHQRRFPAHTCDTFTPWIATETASSIAASSNEKFSGSGYMIRSGTTTYSANAPCLR